jgi:SPP1 gp7 family putative phage head morphogenesis protein
MTTISIDTQRDRAAKFAKQFETASYEMGQAQRFVTDFCEIFGIDHRQLNFSIAGVASLDQLQGVLDSLTAKLADGQSFKQWQDSVAVQDLGLPKHRLDNIFRTNIQNAYNRGHWEQFKENEKFAPYLMYDAINDSRTRPSHRALNGIIRLVSDPFWDTHYPANGYRCRCSVVALSEKQAQARSKGGNGLNKSIDVEKMKPDKGWDYNCGEDITTGIDKAVVDRKANPNIDPKLKALIDDKTSVPRMSLDGVNFGQSLNQKDYEDALSKMHPSLVRLANKIESPKSIIHLVDEQPHYISGTISSNSDKGGHTLRHEYGHHIDEVLDISLNDELFHKAFVDDMKKLDLLDAAKREKFLIDVDSKFIEYDTITSKKGRVFKYMKDDSDTSNGSRQLFDIFDALSSGRIHKDFGIGHGESYYRGIMPKKQETFANLTALRGLEIWDDMKAIIPNLTKRFDDIIAEQLGK